MGHGSSIRPHPKAAQASTDTETTIDGFTSEAQIGHKRRERLDEEARWLRRIIEKEKVEKEWLMARVQNAEKELLARESEAAQLQKQLAAMTQTAPTLVRHASLSSPTSPPSGGSASTSTSLKDRRGLRLMVETNPRVTSKPAENVAPSPALRLEATSKPSENVASSTVLRPEALPLKDDLVEKRNSTSSASSTSRSEAFLNFLDGKACPCGSIFAPNALFCSSCGRSKKAAVPIAEPMTAKADLGRTSWLEEPMSPLLKRRIAAKGGVSSEFVEGRRIREPRSADIQQPAFGSLSALGGGSPKGLNVSTPKIFQLEDCPQTPKRVPCTPKSARHRQEQQWVIHETNDES